MVSVPPDVPLEDFSDFSESYPSLGPEDLAGIFEAGLNELTTIFNVRAFNSPEGYLTLVIPGLRREEDVELNAWYIQVVPEQIGAPIPGQTQNPDPQTEPDREPA